MRIETQKERKSFLQKSSIFPCNSSFFHAFLLPFTTSYRGLVLVNYYCFSVIWTWTLKPPSPSLHPCTKLTHPVFFRSPFLLPVLFSLVYFHHKLRILFPTGHTVVEIQQYTKHSTSTFSSSSSFFSTSMAVADNWNSCNKMCQLTLSNNVFHSVRKYSGHIPHNYYYLSPPPPPLQPQIVSLDIPFSRLRCISGHVTLPLPAMNI